MSATLHLSQRARRIEPFYVMEMAKTAQAVAARAAASGRPMIYLNIGEPDYGAPPLVREAARARLAQGSPGYTQALGTPALREAISGWYAQHFGLEIAASRIAVTAGASGALQLVCLALIDAGDEVLMPDPCYPCNAHFVTAADGRAVRIPTDAAARFQLNAQQVAEHWGERTRAVLLASPSNPTGTSIAAPEMARIHQAVRARGGQLIVDEIYLGLSHDAAYGQSALALGDDVISINSFSKYFGMTGWRLGWVVMPEALVPVFERLAQHLTICPSTLAQEAALACFVPESLQHCEQQRQMLRERRDAFIPALNTLGLTVPVVPDGAFYAWADVRALCARLGLADSWALAHAMLEHAGVAATPGRDFSASQGGHYIRFSTASALPQLMQATERMAQWLRP